MSGSWIRYDAAARTLRVSVYVQPNARKTGLAGLHGEDLKVTVAAPAVDNKANLALIAFFADVLAVPARSVSVRYGATSRRKTLELIDAGPELESRALGLAGAASSERLS